MSALSAKERGKVALWQIKKVLHCHFPDLSLRLSALSDPRKGVQYTIEEILMAAVVSFLLKCSSRNAFNLKSKDKQFRQNYYRMFRLGLPHMDAVNELLEKMDTEAFEALRCRLLSSLIEKRVVHRLRFFSKYFCVAVDATGAYQWGDTPPEAIRAHALKKVSASGKTTYFSLVLEAVLICSNGMSIPLMSEWVANDGQQYDKQDCELKAFKRLAVRMKNYFPRLPICILADGLYTNVALMDICKQYQWQFIVVFKDGNLPSVWEEVNSLLPLERNNTSQQTSCDSTWWYANHYQWVNDIEYQKHNIHWVKCACENQHRKTGEKKNNKFVFLTSMKVERQNVVSILSAGRARWNIEDHFNTQKNRGGELHHKFNRVNFNAVKNWHNIRQLATLIGELVEFSAEMQSLKNQIPKMTWKEIWENLNSLLIMCPIEEVIVEFEHCSSAKRQVRLE